MKRSMIKLAGCTCSLVIATLFIVISAQAADEQDDQSADPLGDISQDMKVATRWLAKSSTDTLTQETQQDAVHKLDGLIAKLEKQQQQNGNGRANMNPQQAMRDSMVHSGPGSMGKLHSPNDEGKHWAELPPHERERILQSMTDGFPAHYQGVLEQYFKRIAEEQPLKAEEQATPTMPQNTPSKAPSTDGAPRPSAASSPALTPAEVESPSKAK
ncbi:MAG TPA: hypothetical protein VFE46_18215 [Pirellulales bacterium]|jgi:hypothetical protein|nr:hypothetical protein [Pirellulales bacterium]